MEGIEAEIEEKILERQPPSEVIEKVIEKPKKPRTQAQKDAFEKARKKRAENLAKKKAERVEEEVKSIMEDDPTPMEVMKQNKIEAPKKKRGRPRGSKAKIVREEPPLQQFIPPHQGYPPMPYPVQGQHYYQPQPQPAPVNNYYYYGHQPHPGQVAHPPPNEPEPEVEKRVQFEERPLSPDPIEEIELEEEYELPEDPRLKFRFA